MFTDLYAQLPTEVQSLFATLAAGLNIDAATLFIMCVAIVAYVIVMTILKKIHRAIIRHKKDTLESYTLAVDELIYTLQKMVSDGLADQESIAWIQNWDPKISYAQAHEELKEKAQLVGADVAEAIQKSYNKYSGAKIAENMIGMILVVLTLGLYKLVW